MRRRRRLAPCGGVLLIVCIGMIAYAPAVSPYLHSDDFVLINWGRLGASVAGPRWFDMGIARAWGFRPLVLAVLGITHEIVGLTGYLYHVIQISVHLVVSLLAGLVSYMALAGSPKDRAAAGLVSAIVLLWPLYHEALMWVSAIAYPLAGALGLLTLVPWSSGTPSPRGYAASVVAFAAALLAHPLAIAWLPGVFVLAATAVGETKTKVRRELLWLLPYLLLSLLYLLLFSGAGRGRLNLDYMRSDLVPHYTGATVTLLAEVFWLPKDLLGPSPLYWRAARAVANLALFAIAVRHMAVRPAQFRLAWAGLVVATTGAAVTVALFADAVPSSRYLYLPTIALALMGGNFFAVIRNQLSRHLWRFDFVAILLGTLFLGSSVASNWRSASMWRRAGELGWKVHHSALEAAARDPAFRGTLDFYALPDHLESAYVFRNGFTELMEMTTGTFRIWGGTSLPPHSDGNQGKQFIWLGENTGFIEFGAGLDAKPYFLGLQPDGFLAQQDVALSLEPGAWCLVAFARGWPALGEQAMIQISLNGEPLAVFTVSLELQPYSLSLPLSSGENMLTVTHINDYYDKERGIDRNLHVPFVIVYPANGACPPSETRATS